MRNPLIPKARLLPLALSLLLGSPYLGYAQAPDYVTNSNLRGVVPFGSYQIGEVDNINLGTGALNVRIPLIARKARGMDYERVSVYSSKMWEVEPRYDPLTEELNGIAWYPNMTVGGFPAGPLQGHLEYNVKDYVCQSDPDITEHVAYNFVYFSPDGAPTRFPNRDYWSTRVGYQGEGFICGGSAVGQTDLPVGQSQSGGMELDTTDPTYVLHFKDGRLRTFLNRGAYGNIKDANGNILSSLIVSAQPSDVIETDTAGRRYEEIYVPTGALTSYDTLKQINANGNAIDAGYRLDYASPGLIETQFSETDLNGCEVTNWRGSLGPLASIRLPNGKSYQFGYDGTFGELTHIGLPTGGSIDYEYVLIEKWDANLPFWPELLDSRRLSRRTVSDGMGHSYEWFYSYSRGWSGDPAGYVTRVKDPNGRVTIHYFDSEGTHEMQTDFCDDDCPDGSTSLRQVVNQWTWDQGPVTWPSAEATMEESGPRDYRIKVTTATLRDADPDLVSKTETSYDSFTYTYGNSQLTGTRTNVTVIKEYDYGENAPGDLLRRTVNSYLQDNDSNYEQRHIVDRLKTQKIYADDTEGSLKAKMEIEYDSSDLPIAGASGAAQHDGTNYGTSFRYRGNPTRIKRWRDTDDSWLTTTNWYDELGNRVKTQEPNLENTTSYTAVIEYVDSWSNSACAPVTGSSYTYGTRVTNALNHISSSNYDSCLGMAGSVTDVNGKTTSYAYDVMGRVPRIERPDGSRTNNTYDDDNLVATSLADLDEGHLQTLKTETVYDGLGRTAETRRYEPDGCVINVFYQYDGFGRVTGVTNPYRKYCSEDELWTTTTYDYLGRVATVTTPDNAVARSRYVANQVTITDQAGKQRRDTTDALGRLRKVEELHEDPSTTVYEDSLTLQAVTLYDYDVLDNLLTVTQASQTRTFAYDSLGRLTSGQNPESQTVTYDGYDKNGNLTHKTDARGIETTYEYDDLNRLKSKTYAGGTPATPTAYWDYDDANVSNSKGRLTQAWSTVSTCTYDEYDALGRVKKSTQTTGAVGPVMMEYNYNLAGDLTSEKYPSGRTVEMHHDTANRIDLVWAGTTAYASQLGYAAHGPMQSVLLGNGRWEQWQFNSRLQPWTIGLGYSINDMDLLKLEYQYQNAQTANNGNVLQAIITATPNQVFTQDFSYDPLNRLETATENYPATTWSQTYAIDVYGNRAATGYLPNSSLTPQSLADFDQATNRLKTQLGWGYDYSGNQTAAPLLRTFAFDAENRLTKFNDTAAIYAYDADGRRVTKTDATGTTTFVYDAMGRLVAEYGAQPEAGGTRYLTQDHLGSTRLVTDESGKVVSRHDYLPYGEEIGSDKGDRNLIEDNGAGSGYHAYGHTDSITQRFSGKERDAESNLDYFGARYFSGPQGRFTSADPLEIVTLENERFAEQISNPQNWNKYAYVRNNPLVYVDPTGEAAILAVNHPYARELAELQREYDSAHGLAKVWAGIKLAFKSNEILPTPFAISYEGAALARAGQSLEGSAQVFTGLGRNPTKVLEGMADGVAFRRPDLLGSSPTLGNIVGEVKDVAKLALTGQLRDAFKAASELGSTVNIFVAERTQFTKPLLEQIQLRGAHIYRYVGKEWKDVTDELLKTIRLPQ
jgi:RHS repeat-associated protein